jgi:hypothetical protein
MPLEENTKAELLQLAKDLGIEADSKMKKAELIKLINDNTTDVDTICEGDV